ncbi:hypothetical protein EJB05_50712 [Eragrostis curvula]|uniref:NAC domain-containing protein n=1 Tax=Eragrostis curvula TaxID=38414 RepID=A0A5J9SXR6_9POAL|nr:hypothetical protein EJB05_50712 [Eragrostis curvula]
MVERGVKSEQGDLFLPPGFRFHPTDEEVITSYLLQKFLNPSFSPRAMGEVNLNTCEPWDLPSKAKMGEKEWYFFCHKGMKYPTGSRANRATKEGYWKATGRDREIFKTASASASAGGDRELVGMKKTLVFYMGRAPRGTKTNWVMHEYRLEGKSKDNNSNLRFNPKDEWVVCKVFNKKVEEKKAAVEYSTGTPNVSSISVVDAAGDDGDDFIDSLIDPMYFHSTGSLPNNTETTMNAAVAPYNAAATTRSSAVGSFVNLPNYTFNDTTTSRNLHQAAIANSTVPTSSIGYSSSWNLLQENHAMGSSYNLHDQAMMARALGGVISPNFSGGLPSYSAAVPGISQQNSLGVPQQKLEPGYGGSYATNYLTSGAAANSTVIGKAARNLGA